MRQVRVIAVALCLALVACGAPEPEPTFPDIRLATLDHPSGAVCPLALAHGVLALNEHSGLGLLGPDGSREPVRWPFGYTARVIDGEPTLINETGLAVAQAGDVVEFGGGVGINDFFFVCPAQVIVVDE